jgi:hypothetical protein
MEIIIRPRQGGKTTEALQRAAEHFAYIVVATRQEADELWARAKLLKLDIPMPITWDEFRRGRYYRKGVKGFVIDNLDRCIQSDHPVPVVAVTMNDGQVANYNSPNVAVEPGRVDGYGRKHFRVTVGDETFTGYLEPAADPRDISPPTGPPLGSDPLFLGKLDPEDFR